MSILHSAIKGRHMRYFLLCSLLLCTMLSACSAASTSPNSASDSLPKMSEHVREFFEEHNLTLADKPGWIPSQILDYVFGTYETFEDKMKDKIKGYITTINQDEVGINEVVWISNTNKDSGFEILDPSPEVILYPLSEDAEVWILTEMVHIQIPLQDLKSYVEKYQYTLWNIGLKDGKIIALIEQYVP